MKKKWKHGADCQRSLMFFQIEKIFSELIVNVDYTGIMSRQFTEFFR